MLEPVAPSCLSINPCTATGSQIMFISTVLGGSKRSPVYYFCLEKGFKEKEKGRHTGPVSDTDCHKIEA